MVDVKSLYIHIPFCISKCKYCDFFSVPCGNKNQNHIIPDSYVDSLCNEIKYRLESYNVTHLDTIYIGGGTPSLLTYNQLESIFDSIKAVVKSLSPLECEITIESNPDDVTEDLIKTWESVGITRISLGVQSFDDGALSYVGRRASAAVNFKALECIRGQWSGELSLDFICGLPTQSAESFENDLKLAMKYKPDHISMYSLTIEDETPLGQEYNSGKLNYDFDFADDLWLKCKDLLKENGYVHYEVSNFCKPGKECKHNLKYWNHQSYIGVGSGGAGTIYYADGSGHRWTNLPNIPDYTTFWGSVNNKSSLKNEENIIQTENISLEISKFEFFMMGLRKLSGIKSIDYENIFHEKIPNKILNNFEKWQKNKLCEIVKDEENPNNYIYTLGQKGIIYLNKFLEEIM